MEYGIRLNKIALGYDGGIKNFITSCNFVLLELTDIPYVYILFFRLLLLPRLRAVTSLIPFCRVQSMTYFPFSGRVFFGALYTSYPSHYYACLCLGRVCVIWRMHVAHVHRSHFMNSAAFTGSCPVTCASSAKW